MVRLTEKEWKTFVKRRNVKAVLSACAAGALVLPLVACGSSSSDSVTVSFLSWSDESIMSPLVEEFEEENPDITIDFSYSPPVNEYIQTLQTRLVGDQAPDVFIITSENKADLIENGYVLDLTDEPFMENISEANKDFVSSDGKVYGMSISSWASGIIYNVDMLADVGYDEPPETWDEFLELCGKLQDAGYTPFLEAIGDGASRITDAFMGQILASEGVDFTTLIDEDPQTPGADFIDVMNEWMRIYDEGYVSTDVVGVSGTDLVTEFVGQSVAMISYGPWDFDTLTDCDFDWDFAKMPLYEEGLPDYAQGSPSPAYAIYSGLEGEELEAAKTFLEFLASDYTLDYLAEGNGELVTVENYDLDLAVDQYDIINETYLQTGQYFLCMNFYDNPDVLNSTMAAETQDLVSGNITVDEWAANVDEAVQTAS